MTTYRLQIRRKVVITTDFRTKNIPIKNEFSPEQSSGVSGRTYPGYKHSTLSPTPLSIREGKEL
jgi:hypothetical protein